MCLPHGDWSSSLCPHYYVLKWRRSSAMSSQGTCARRPAENLDPSCHPYSPCPESRLGDLSQKTYNREEKLGPPLPSDSGCAPQFSSDRPLCSHQTPWTREAADHQRPAGHEAGANYITPQPQGPKPSLRVLHKTEPTIPISQGCGHDQSPPHT